MAVPFTTANTNNYVKGQRSRWRGGPRLPVSAWRQRARSKDDLEVQSPSNVSSDNSFATAMLAEHLNKRESSTRVPVNRVSRRWALDSETEERWLQLLQAGPPSKPHPPGPTSASSVTDTRWQFYGPRQPRRNHQIRLSADHCPCMALDSPDTPELETPDDKVPESYVSMEKSVESDADDDASLCGPEFLITPFPLWEHPPTHSVTTEGRTATEINDDAQCQPVAFPPLQFLPDDRSGAIQSSMWSQHHGIVPGTPTNFHSEASHLRRSPRPQLSIVTSSSWSRSSNSICGKFWSTPTSTRLYSSPDLQFPNEPISLSPLVSNNVSWVQILYHVFPFLIIPFRSALSQLTELLVADIFQDRLKYKVFLAYRGDEAQIVLDCLQVVSLISPVPLCLFEPCCQSGPRFMFFVHLEQDNPTASSHTSIHKLSTLSSLFQTSRSKDVRRRPCWSRAVWGYLERYLSWPNCLRQDIAAISTNANSTSI